MKTKAIGLVLISLLTLSCGKTKNAESVTSGTTTTNTVTTESDVNEKLSNRIKEFVTWYGKNQPKLSEIALVNNAQNVKPDPKKFYSINFENTEKYLAEFKQSGNFSDKYLENQRNFFKKCEADFIANKENEGPPTNFDADIVLKSQDGFITESLVRDLKIKNMNVTENIVKLTADFGDYHSLNFTFSQENGVWKIDDIAGIEATQN